MTKYNILWYQLFNLKDNDSSPDVINILCSSRFVTLVCMIKFNLVSKTMFEQRKLSNYLFMSNAFLKKLFPEMIH